MKRTTRIGLFALLLLTAGCGDSDSDRRSANKPAGGGGRPESPDADRRAAYEARREEAKRANERRQAEKLAWERERARRKKALEERLAGDLTAKQVTAYIAKARAEVDRQRQDVARIDAEYTRLRGASRSGQGTSTTDVRHARKLARSKLGCLQDELRSYERKLGSIKAEQRELERLTVKQAVAAKNEQGFAYMLEHKWAQAKAAFLSVKQVPGASKNAARAADEQAARLDRLIELRGKPASAGAFAAKDKILRQAADQAAEIKAGAFDIAMEKVKTVNQTKGRKLGPAGKMEIAIARKFFDKANQRAMTYGMLQLGCMSLTVEQTRPVAARAVESARREIANLERERDEAIAEAKRKKAFERVGSDPGGSISSADMKTLRQALRSDDRRTLWDAMRTVKRMGAGARVFLPELVRLAGSGQSLSTRRDAMDALGAIGPEAKEGVNALLAATADPNDTVSRHAAETLGKFGPAVKEIVPALVDRMLKTESGWLQGSLDSLVRKLDPEGKTRAPILMQALSTETDRGVRSRIIYALGSVSGKRKDVIPTLVRLLKTEKERSMLWPLISALGNIGRGLGAEGKVVVAPLMDVLKHPEPSTRRRAVRALDGLDLAAVRDNPALVAALNELVKDEDRWVVRAARSLLTKLEKHK